MGMKHTEESIALQAVEFWSTVCEIETDLAWELQEVRLRDCRTSLMLTLFGDRRKTTASCPKTRASSSRKLRCLR